MKLAHGEPPEEDCDLEHPRCVFQVLKRHFARYTPEMVERVCGVPRGEVPRASPRRCVENSGRERTAAICYAVGWTQHTHGVQNIRAAAIIQLLLGNIGRPGGGILALRGHANIQGSTDIPTLYDILPGLHPDAPPAVARRRSTTFVEQERARRPARGARCSRYMVSLLKAWWGDAATADNDFCFDYLPRIDGDHSHYPTMLRMIDGDVQGLLRGRPEPGRRLGQLRGCSARRCANLDWLVVRDLDEIETATFWYDCPEVETGEVRPQDIGTEVFFLPAAAHTEKDGTFTNTQRLLQWHHKAVEPPEDCRSELLVHLPPRPARSARSWPARPMPRDRPLLDLTWDYPTGRAARGARRRGGPAGDRRPHGRRRVRVHLRGAGRRRLDHLRLVDPRRHLRRRRQPDRAQASPRAEQNWIAPEWGWAWPKNRRILYNRASADPDGQAVVGAQALRLVGRRAGQVDRPRRRARLPADKAPDYRAARGRQGDGRDPRRRRRSSSTPTGSAGCTRPTGLVDGPLPTHYEPHESPFAQPALRPAAQPDAPAVRPRGEPYNPAAASRARTCSRSCSRPTG